MFTFLISSISSLLTIQFLLEFSPQSVNLRHLLHVSSSIRMTSKRCFSVGLLSSLEWNGAHKFIAIRGYRRSRTRSNGALSSLLCGFYLLLGYVGDVSFSVY